MLSRNPYPVFLAYVCCLHDLKMAVVSLETSSEFLEGGRGKDKGKLLLRRLCILLVDGTLSEIDNPLSLARTCGIVGMT